MKKIIAFATALSLATLANAALTVYEPFNYTALINGTAATGTGLTGNWSCGAAGSIGTGLTYSGLTVANSALSSGGSRQSVNFANPLSSGTKWISFLYKASGNMGGNIDGVFFPNGNSSCLWFGFGLGPFSGTQGQLGLGSMTTAGTGAQGASSLQQIGLGTYGNTYLIVLRVDFNTSGTSDTVTLYTNPVANASAPGVVAAGTLTTYDVGTISGIGLNVQGGANITVDEIRVGDSYGDVAGYAGLPAAPTGLTATPGVNAAGLSWNATSGAAGYQVLRGTATGVYNTTNFVAANTNYDTTVVGGTTYFYVVQATNSSGAGASSPEVSVTPTIALPGVPGGLTASGTNGAVWLNWTGGSGAASYNVKRATSSGVEVTIATSGTTSYTDVSVVNGTPYFYKISSTNNAGESANSSEASATPNLPPAAPTGLTATAGTNQVILAWTASTGAVSYNIKRSITSGSGYSLIGTVTAPTVTYTDSTAVKLTQYFYVVSAVSSYGEGANANPEATATPAGAYGPSAYEPFNYATGTFANNTPSTGTGFTGNWSVSASPTIVAGLTYPSLPTTANAYQHSAAGAQTTVNLVTPLSSGTKFISFLFKGSGDSGGDTVGVYFKGNNANSLFAGFHVPNSAVTTGFGLGTVNSTALGGATGLGSTVAINNTAVHLIVLEIDFNTAGVNDTVSMWIDPPAGVAAPGVAANVVNNTFDVGTISAFGINITGGYNPVIDEVRVGDFYGDVVGYGAANTSATVTLGNLSQTYDGTAKIVTAATAPTGLTVNLTYNASTTAPTNAGNYQVIGTVADAVYTGSATNTLTVAKATATVLLTNLSQVYDGTAKNVTAMTAPSGLTVAYTYNGSATAPVNIGTYQVVGLVSDNNYFGGATNSFVIVSGYSSAPTNITATVAGNQITLNWPSDHQGWILQAQTNRMGVGMTTNWVNVPGSDTSTQAVIRVDPANPTVFFRLRTPPVPVQPPAGLQTVSSGTTNAIGLAWTASPTPGVTGYRVLYGTDSGSLTNSVNVGNATGTVLAGLTAGQTYYIAVIALSADGQSPAAADTIAAQPDGGIVPLFDASTLLEPETSVVTTNALITYLADRARDRHARESQFMLYDHYLSWYWQQRVANIQIIDHVAKGGTDIIFNYTTQDQLNPAEFRTFYRGITTVAEYNNNQQATLVSTNPSLVVPGETDFNYTASVSANAQFNRPLQIGDRVEVEISQFLLDPMNGRDNYYGTVLLYVVGKGIVPWEEGQDQGLTGGVVGNVNQNLDSYPMSTNGWLGGLVTLPYQYSNEPSNHFKEFAGNISPASGNKFMLGRRLHHTDFGDGTHSEPDNPIFTNQIGKLGPKFVNRSCIACHVNNGRALPPAIGAPMLQSVVKVGSDASGTPDPVLGSELQPQSVTGPAEGSVTISSYTTTSGQYGDGTPYSLQKPNYTFQGTTPAFFSVRLAPQLVGLGLLEAVSESTISALADPTDANRDGIAGRTQTVKDPVTGQMRLGRFNYKAGKARLSHQVAAALNNDMGVTTTVFPVLDGDTNSGPVEISDIELDQMTRYISVLGVSARRNLTNAQALQGEQLFASANCVKCHVPTLTTSPYHPITELRNQTIHPYTDLLLHDLGPGLADNMGEGVATGAQWRTPPLWSIGLTAGISQGEAYLHDGRARTLEEAILWHDGEAEASKEAFRNMSAPDRAAIIAFMKSL